MNERNIRRHDHSVSPEERAAAVGHRGAVVWLTGLSGSGKSSIAMALEKRLLRRKIGAFVLDGDNVRYGLCRDLGFSDAERHENIRRIREVAKLMCEASLVTITSFISPFRADRDACRAMLPEGRFFEVYVGTPIEVCRSRDPKGLYAKADRGELVGLTGVDAPYEAPTSPDLIVGIDGESIEDAAARIEALLLAAS